MPDLEEMGDEAENVASEGLEGGLEALEEDPGIEVELTKMSGKPRVSREERRRRQQAAYNEMMAAARRTSKSVKTMAGRVQMMIEAGNGRVPVSDIENVLLVHCLRKIGSAQAQSVAEGLEMLMEIYKKRTAVEKPQAPAGGVAGSNSEATPPPEVAPVMPVAQASEKVAA